ncbi:hypothetical protein GPECTOR_12g578 [Gonium pectorale]|uniref:BRCT domain-containing protein n=1 Tax=Gonium pectorale TaxID=33097 RepID=A0A150GP86_GONPE|nr:hypothetical protein GPECTOR_12g578 [Gonium pectorale]|eukprot:KXZ51614.1 hypothetical protein GPECTOR_12g578 [Gonium pectorale]
MDVNPLLQHPELGTVKKTLFNNPPAEKVFGYTPPKDPEGAREVMMLWKGHNPSLSQEETKPSPDFKTLNKMAVASGLSTAKEQPPFRREHAEVTLRTATESSAASPRRSTLPTIPPSKVGTTFGMPSAHRSAEIVRTHGPEEPPVKYLVQGAFQDEWVRKNLEAEAAGSGRSRPYIPPQPTKAVLGHSYGASRYMQPPNDEEPWKMSKFKTVSPRVTQYSGGSFTRPRKSSPSATADLAAAEAQAEASFGSASACNACGENGGHVVDIDDAAELIESDSPNWGLVAGPHDPGLPGMREYTRLVRVSGIPSNMKGLRLLLQYWVEALGGQSADESFGLHTSHVLTWQDGDLSAAQLAVEETWRPLEQPPLTALKPRAEQIQEGDLGPVAGQHASLEGAGGGGDGMEVEPHNEDWRTDAAEPAGWAGPAVAGAGTPDATTFPCGAVAQPPEQQPSEQQELCAQEAGPADERVELAPAAQQPLQGQGQHQDLEGQQQQEHQEEEDEGGQRRQQGEQREERHGQQLRLRRRRRVAGVQLPGAGLEGTACSNGADSTGSPSTGPSADACGASGTSPAGHEDVGEAPPPAQTDEELQAEPEPMDVGPVGNDGGIGEVEPGAEEEEVGLEAPQLPVGGSDASAEPSVQLLPSLVGSGDSSCPALGTEASGSQLRGGQTAAAAAAALAGAGPVPGFPVGGDLEAEAVDSGSPCGGAGAASPTAEAPSAPVVSMPTAELMTEPGVEQGADPAAEPHAVAVQPKRRKRVVKADPAAEHAGGDAGCAGAEAAGAGDGAAPSLRDDEGGPGGTAAVNGGAARADKPSKKGRKGAAAVGDAGGNDGGGEAMAVDGGSGDPPEDEAVRDEPAVERAVVPAAGRKKGAAKRKGVVMECGGDGAAAAGDGANAAAAGPESAEAQPPAAKKARGRKRSSGEGGPRAKQTPQVASQEPAGQPPAGTARAAGGSQGAAGPLVTEGPAAAATGNAAAAVVRHTKLVFALSGFSAEDRGRYGGLLKSLRMTYVPLNNDWDARINALLAPALKRSDKTVCAMASGAWLLRAEYLSACQRAAAAGGGSGGDGGGPGGVNPEEYELQDCEDGASVISSGAPAHWRRRAVSRGGGPSGLAFSGLRLLVPPGLPPPLDSATLGRMLAAGGGVAVVKAATAANAKGCHAGIVPAGCKQEDKMVAALRAAGAAVVSPAYLVDWVAHPHGSLAQHYRHGSEPGESLAALERERGVLGGPI